MFTTPRPAAGGKIGVTGHPLGPDPTPRVYGGPDLSQGVNAFKTKPGSVSPLSAHTAATARSFAYFPVVHSSHTRRDRVVPLPPRRLYGAAVQRAPPLRPSRVLSLPRGWNIPQVSSLLSGKGGLLAGLGLSGTDQNMAARPSLIPSLCIHLTRAGIEWRRRHHSVCMARPYEEPHHTCRAES